MTFGTKFRCRIRTLEAKLERQRGELQEVQELLAEAAATDDAEFIEEASQEVASREVRPLMEMTGPQMLSPGGFCKK